MSNAEASDRGDLVLLLTCAAQFMVILDVAIIGIAVPSIQRDLAFAAGDLQWVATAYGLAFGSLLLLGGRAADLLGRRRMFIAGIAAFTLASLLCGLAWAPLALVAARALQGVGAAVLTPAALSIISTTFAEGAERNRALGIWGAVGGIGATAGLLIGGALTDAVGWEWVFWINVPVGVGVMAAVPRVISESRGRLANRSFDLAGAAAVTLAGALLVLSIVEAPDAGWGSAQTILLLGGALALLGGFVAVEARAAAPLMPLGILRRGVLAKANVAGGVWGASIFGGYFVVTLYMQQVLGYSPMDAGLAFLAASLVAIAAAVAAQAAVTRVGVVPVLTIAMLCLAAMMAFFTRLSPGGSFVDDLLPGVVLFGVGASLGNVAITVGALGSVPDSEQGLASGLINTAQQLGAAIGIAVLSTVAVARSSDLAGSGPPDAAALTEGFAHAFGVAIALPAVGLLVAATMLRFRAGGPEAPPEAAVAAEQGRA